MVWNILICVSLFLSVCSCLSSLDEVQEYLRKRREDTTAILSNLNEKTRDNFKVNVEYQKNETYVSPSLAPTPKIKMFMLFNQNYIATSKMLHSLNHIQCDPQKTFILRDVLIIDPAETPYKEITFLKSTEYGKDGILFGAVSGGFPFLCFYSGNHDRWHLIQTIEISSPISDAMFFKDQENLYLIVAIDDRNFLGHTLIYKWTGSYFDKINKVSGENILQMAKFTDNQENVLAFLEQSKSHMTNIVFYKFTEGTVEKIQIIKNLSANHIEFYKYSNKVYLAVFQNASSSTLYIWNGYEFTIWKQFGNYSNATYVLSTSIQGYPIIFAILNKDLIAFVHSARNFTENKRLQLPQHYQKILDVKIGHRGDERTLVIFLKTKTTIEELSITFGISLTKIEMEKRQKPALTACFNKLTDNVSKNYLKISLAINYVQSHHTKPSPPDPEPEPVLQSFRDHLIANLQLENTIQDDVEQLRTDVNKLKWKFDAVKPSLEIIFQKEDILNGNIVVEQNLKGCVLETKNLQIDYLNNHTWQPDSWLSYSKDQNIRGKTWVQNLTSISIVAQNQSFYDDIISRKVNINNVKELDSLSADSISSYKINNILIDDLYSRKNPVKISGTKSFQNLDVRKLTTIGLNQHKGPEIIKFLPKINSKVLELKANLTIKNLYVNTINDVNWNTFKDSVFQIGKSQIIKGSLRAPSIKTTYLATDLLSNIDSSLLFTLVTDQVVSSNISFVKFNIAKFDCMLINDVDFGKQAVWESNTIIKGPVSFDNLIVNKVLKGAPGSKIIFNDNNISDMEELHIYRDVRITGNLYISDLEVPSSAKVLINDRPFKLADFDKYWQKSKNQVLPNHIEAVRGISAPSLKIGLLNNLELSRYMQNNLESKLFTKLLFENLTIIGNIHLNPLTNHTPNWEKIKVEAVRKNGTFYITGHKTFLGDVSVGNLETKYLDDIILSNCLTTKTPSKFSGVKEFENILIKTSMSSENLITGHINGLEPDYLDKNVLFKNRPEVLKKLNAVEVLAKSLNLSLINDHHYDEYLQYANQIESLQTINRIKINGDVYFGNVQNVSTINSFTINELLGEKISSDSQNVRFNHDMKFLDNVYAETLEVDTINNINITALMNRLLYRSGDQNITAQYEFDKIATPNIRVPKINDINTANIIDISSKEPQTLVVENGLRLTSPSFLKSLNAGSFLCDIPSAVDYLKSLPTLSWEKFHVMSNVTLLDDESDLHRVLHKSLNSKLNNTVTAPVVFEHSISGRSLNLETVNSLSFGGIINDSLLTYGDEQVITGQKTFKNLEIGKGVVFGNTDIQLINNIDIEMINRSIIFKDTMNETVIEGQKTFFYGLEANNLISSQLLDLNENVVSLANLSTIPSVNFMSLEVDNNLSFELINGMNISDILKNRILRNSEEEQLATGTYYLDNLELSGSTHINQINDLPIDDVVFDIDYQFITGLKSFAENVVVHQNVSLDSINGINLTSTREASILNGEMVNTTGNIKFNNFTAINKKILTDKINGISVDYLTELIESSALNDAEIEAQTIKQQISSLAEDITDALNDMPNTFMYIENSKDVRLFLPNVTNVKIEMYQENVIFHIIQTQPGSFCGFDDNCLCVKQEDIQITKELSINTITEVDNEIIFNYNDDEMSIQVYSSCMDDARLCNNQDVNKTITFNWNINFPRDSRGSFAFTAMEHGYIKDMEFFRYQNHVHAIIVKSVDFVKFDCVIYQFDTDQKTILPIQNIESSGSLIHLVNTSQGVTLILKGAKKSQIGSPVVEIEIYRFDGQRFYFLQKVARPNPVDITSVVSGLESYIAFAYDNSNLEIFEYNPEANIYVEERGQSFNSAVIGLSVFYSKGIQGDPYMCIVESNDNFFVYSFNHQEIVYSGKIKGLLKLLPFTLNAKQYLLAITNNISYVLTIIQQGL